MKKERIYTIIIFISGVIHLLLLLFSWKIKSESAHLFTYIPILLIISFSLNIILLLRITGIFSFPVKEAKSPPKEINSISEKEEQLSHTREIINPKTSVEKLLKNVMLKRTLQGFGEKLLSNFARAFDIMQGIFYSWNEKDQVYEPKAFYAITESTVVRSFRQGESIPGQAAMKDDITVLKDLPGNYRTIESGLGNHVPGFIYFIPLLHEKKCVALIEISCFKKISEQKLNALNYFMNFSGKKYIQFTEKINV